MRHFISSIIFIFFTISAFADVEIYSKGRAGTAENPILSDGYASFSARFDGFEAWQLQGIGFRWRSNPPVQAFGSDISTVSFLVPDWQTKREFEVVLTIPGGSYSGEYRESFWVVPRIPEPDPEPEPEPEPDPDPEPEPEPDPEPGDDVDWLKDVLKTVRFLETLIESRLEEVSEAGN